MEAAKLLMAKSQAEREAGTGVRVGAENGAGSGGRAEAGAEAEPWAQVGAQVLYLLFPQTPFPLPQN